jgi:hypothetical protein
MNASTHWYSCQRCGRFAYSAGAFGDGPPSPQVRALVCGYVREQNERGNRAVEVNRQIAENIRNLAPRGVQEKADRLLQALARQSRWPGDDIRLVESRDYPLAYSFNEEELNFFVLHLAKSGLLGARSAGQETVCTLSAAGWSRVEQLQKSGGESLKAFAAMSFRDDMKSAFADGIRPAVEACGYRPMRIDNKEYLGGVFDEIVAEIRESRFVIADLTHQRQGVYDEAGFALVRVSPLPSGPPRPPAPPPARRSGVGCERPNRSRRTASCRRRSTSAARCPAPTPS